MNKKILKNQEKYTTERKKGQGYRDLDLSMIIVSSEGHDQITASHDLIRKITQCFLNSIIDPLDSAKAHTQTQIKSHKKNLKQARAHTRVIPPESRCITL
ncbi:hypothetical protein ABZP36_011097 [Zizania latifolia]